MTPEKGFIGGFLVLGFAIFITGFLVGMLAIALITVNADTTFIGTVAFALGFLLGLLTLSLVLVTLRFTQSNKTLSDQPTKKDAVEKVEESVGAAK